MCECVSRKCHTCFTSLVLTFSDLSFKIFFWVAFSCSFVTLKLTRLQLNTADDSDWPCQTWLHVNMNMKQLITPTVLCISHSQLLIKHVEMISLHRLHLLIKLPIICTSRRAHSICRSSSKPV